MYTTCTCILRIVSFRPNTLWVLNPSVLLQPKPVVNETDSLLSAGETSPDYGTIIDKRESEYIEYSYMYM